MTDFTQPTKQMFESLFEKPKMSEKLLAKPPFKYIFDIITQTQKQTGFGNNLYTNEEQDPAYYQDKNQKITYLQKMLDLINLMNNSNIDAKPIKIVAGLEPEKTNIFLQGVYQAAVSGDDSVPFVGKVLQKYGQAPPPKQDKPAEKVPEKAPEKAPQKAPEKVEKKPKKEPEPEQQKNAAQNRPTSASKRPPQLKQNQQVSNERQGSGTSGIMREDEPVEQRQEEEQVRDTGMNSKKVQELMKDDEVPGGNLEPQQEEETQQEGIKLGGGKKKKKKKITASNDTDKTLGSNTETTKTYSTISSNNQAGIPEIEKLTKLIQTVCQNSNPLGKSLEFINDDIESMNKVIEYWSSSYKKSKEKMQHELKITDEHLQPVQDKIAEIDEQIFDQKLKIQAVKAQIIKNQSTIQTLLYSVVANK